MSTNPSNPADVAGLIAALDDQAAIRTLHTVARARLRNGPEVPEWTPALRHALCEELGVAATGSAEAPPGDLARETLKLLAQDPEYAEPIAALLEGPSTRQFSLDPVGGTLLITAALFALQSHIEIARDKEGRWTFKFKKTPTKDTVVIPLLKRLIALLPGGSPDVG